VKHWVHYKSTSHSPPTNQPVSTTAWSRSKSLQPITTLVQLTH